jgi:branched-chain amino acid aminotransferase
MINEKDRGFLLGDGVFETMQILNRVALWRTEHLARMEKSAAKIGIPFQAEEINGMIDRVLSRIAPSHQVMRINMSRGLTARGLAEDGDAPKVVSSCDPMDAAIIGKPLSLITSSLRRNPASISDRNKTLSYVNSVYAAREAKVRGADDALMLNIDGLVASISVANVFIMNGKVLATPPEEDGILPGIIRRSIIDNAAKWGYAIEVRSIERDELANADAVFITNSLRLVAPVHQLDGERLQKGDTTALMNQVVAAAEAQCGAKLMEKKS